MRVKAGRKSQKLVNTRKMGHSPTVPTYKIFQKKTYNDRIIIIL